MHRQRVGVARSEHPPTHDPLRERIADRGQPEPAAARRGSGSHRHLQAVRARRGEVQDHRVRRRRRRQILRGRPRPPLAARMGVLKPAWPITRSIRLRPTASSTNSTSTSTSCGRRSPRTSPKSSPPSLPRTSSTCEMALIATPVGSPDRSATRGPGAAEGSHPVEPFMERTAARRCPWSLRCPPQHHRNCTSKTMH